jgi:outer membrane protein assembly factor BamB
MGFLVAKGVGVTTVGFALGRSSLRWALVGAVLATGCAARWSGPEPPVEVVPAALPAVEDSGIPSERLWTYKHNTFLGAGPVPIGTDLAAVDRKGRVVFIDPNSGRPRARAKTKYPLEEALAWDSERFYVVQPAPRRRLEALRFADGRSVWHREFTRAPRRPIIYGGELLVAAGDSVFALEPASGRRIRTVAVSEAAWLAPVEVDSGLLLADQRGRVRLCDPSGALRWEHDLAMALDAPPTVTSGGVVFAGSEGEIVRLEVDGRESWRDTIGTEPLYAPKVEGERVFVVGREGEVTALDLATGAVIWQRALSAPGAQGLAAHGSWVAAGSIDGVLWLLDPADGEVLDTLGFGELIHTAPEWAFGRLFIVTENKKLHALGLSR